MRKKLLALFLALVMLLGMVSTVRAEEAEEEPQIVDKGKIEMCKWTLYNDGNLLIEGNLLVSEYAIPWRDYAEQITKVSLIGTNFSTRLLDNLPNLTTVHFPNSPAKVQGCFNNCPKFTAFTSGKDGKDFVCRDGYLLNMSGARLFRAPTGLSGKVALPDYVTIVDDRAFLNCEYIEEVVFQEGFDSIGVRAFMNCTGLKTVVFPTSLRMLWGQIFDGCTALESIYFTGDSPIDGEQGVNSGGPVFGDYNEDREPADTRITANVYYPADNETWTEENRAEYGGSVTWVPYNPENPFRDVPLDAFYEEPVLWALENGITTGATEDTFNPNSQCLRAHVVTFLHRAAEYPEPASTTNPFTDVKTTDFFYKPVLWAVEKGITNGVSATEFGSYAVCNRAAVVTFLWRAAGSPEPESASNPFTDVKTTDFFYKPVLWAVENGITNGLSATEFGPTAPCNRAQVVTFLYRAYN